MTTLTDSHQHRGLDLFQWFEFNAFNAAAVVQEARSVKGCEINYLPAKS